MNWKELPDDARVWIYQSNRKLTTKECAALREQADLFLQNWASHGTPLRAAIEIFHDLFLVVFVDEKHAQATGCSIDKSVGFVKSIEQNLGIDFMDRMQVAYKSENGIGNTRLPKLAELAKAGVVSASTVVFNNLVTDKSQFEKSWEVAIKDSWHERYLN